MNCRKSIVLGSMGLACTLIAGSVLCFPTPSTARVINSDALTIQLNQTEETKIDIFSNLLTEDGQIILLNNDFTEITIPITVSCESTKIPGTIGGTVKAISSDEEKMTVSLDTENVDVGETESTVNLTIRINDVSAPEQEEETTTETDTDDESESETMPEPDTEVEGETETIPDVDSEGKVETEAEITESEVIEEEVTEDEVQSQDIIEAETEVISTTKANTMVESEKSSETAPETENISETEVIPDTETTPETEDAPDTENSPETEATPDTESTPETETTPETDNTPGTEEAPETEEVPETGNIPESGSETETEDKTETEDESEEKEETETEDIPDEETDAAIENSVLSVEVTFTYGEQNYSATIIVDDSTETADTADGELAFCPSQYDPTETVKIINGQEADCTFGDFPALTRYMIENQTYLLYDGGSITLPAGKEAELDFSQTGLEQDLTFTAINGKTYTMKYVELPQISVENFPLIMNEEGIKIPFSSMWGTIEPTITIENLTISEEAPVWETVKSVTAVTDNNDNLQLTPVEAEAGTYRAVVSWIENEITLYRMEIPFFIQYQSVDQGGTGQ